jgi:predicted nucleic acid-binding Zn ribbon protein
MLKIRCHDCDQAFIWADDMPPRGKCPNPNCEGTYDVHQALKENIDARTFSAADSLLCPACGGAIPSCWGLCPHCGRFTAGSRSFRKRDIFLAVALLLLILSLLVRLAL